MPRMKIVKQTGRVAGGRGSEQSRSFPDGGLVDTGLTEAAEGNSREATERGAQLQRHSSSTTSVHRAATTLQRRAARCIVGSGEMRITDGRSGVV